MKKEDVTVKENYVEHIKKYSHTSVEYFINKDKKTVVCKLHLTPDYSHDPYGFVSTNEEFAEAQRTSFAHFVSDNNIVFVGKSVCTEPDVFDVEFGKRLAHDRAVKRLLRAEYNFYKKWCDQTLHFVAIANELMNSVGIRIENLDKRIDNRIGGTK